MRAAFFILTSLLLAIPMNSYPVSTGDDPDSLKKELSDEKNVTQSLILNKLGHYYLNDSPATAFNYYSRSYAISRLLNIDSLKAIASSGMGLAKYNKEEYKDSKGYLLQALDIFRRFNNTEQIAEINKFLGLAEYYQGNYEEAIKDYQEALKIYIRLNREQEEANIYQNMGLVHHELNNTENALYYYKKSLHINERLKNKRNIAGLTQNLGLIYIGNDEFDAAKENITKSYKIYKDLDDKEGMGISLSNNGLICQKSKEYTQALRYYKESLKVFNEIDFEIGKILAMHNVGTSYSNLKDLSTALTYYEKSLELAKHAGYVQGIMANYEAISNLYADQNDYKKSLEYFKLFDDLEDSIKSVESKNKIMEMEAEYKLELLDNELTIKSKELAQQKLYKKFLSIGILILLSLLVIIIVAYIQKRKVEKELHEHKLLLEKQVEQKSAELKTEISERKIAEESDRLKSAFLSNMSHELRTPMNAILAFSNFIRDPDLTKAKRDEYINYVTTAGESLLGLIDDIIDIARIEARQLTISKSSCNITAICFDLLNMFNELKNKRNKEHIILTLDRNCLKNSVTIDTDGHRLRQILNNLLENAIKYTVDGFVEFGFTRQSTYLQFYVKDSGIGIPESKFQYIFERFSQIDPTAGDQFGGTGLGLAITKNLVELLGGKIWVESAVQAGSTFYFTIPFKTIEIGSFSVQELRKSSLAANMLLHYDWKGKKILIAEDEDLNYKVLESALSRTKAKIYRAINGAEAVDIFRDSSFHLVLMDIQMPVMDGYIATQQIKKIDSKVPVIAQTSFAMEGEREKCLLSGCDDYLSKPLNLNEMLSKIDRYIIR